MSTRQYIGPFAWSGYDLTHAWNKKPLDGNYIYIRVWFPTNDPGNQISNGADWHRVATSDGNRCWLFRKIANNEGGIHIEDISPYSGGLKHVRMWEIA